MKKWLINLSKSSRYFVVLLPLIIFAVFIIIFAVTDSPVMLVLAIISFGIGIVFLYFNGQVEQQIKKDKEKAASEEQARKHENNDNVIEHNELIKDVKRMQQQISSIITNIDYENLNINELTQKIQLLNSLIPKLEDLSNKLLQQNEQEYYNELQECLQSATHTIHGLSGLIRQSKQEAVSDSTANNKSEAYKSSPLTITIGIGNQTIAKSKIDGIKKANIETVTVIDFETANHSFTSACSIGIAVIKGNEIVDRQYYLIQPPNNFYTNDNIAIHHITPADTNDAETFPAVWEKIKYLFENTYLAAHNAIFDMSVLKATLNYYNLPQPHFEYVNTIAVSSYAIPQGLNIRKSLDARCEYFGITLDNHHNALADAEAAAQLILCNLAHSKFKSAATFLRSNSSYLKNYDDVKIQEEAEFKRYNRVDVNEIAASTTVNEEKDADFNGKTFVITGEFKTMTREQALSTVVARGGIIKNSVSSKVDILVNADDRTSIKTEKAAELQAAGHHIKVINEEQFMRMLESNDAIEL